MIEALAIAAVAAGFSAAFFAVVRDHAQARADWAKKEERYLDRIMARDLVDFKSQSGDRPWKPVRRTLTDEEEWEREQRKREVA